MIYIGSILTTLLLQAVHYQTHIEILETILKGYGPFTMLLFCIFGFVCTFLNKLPERIQRGQFMLATVVLFGFADQIQPKGMVLAPLCNTSVDFFHLIFSIIVLVMSGIENLFFEPTSKAKR